MVGIYTPYHPKLVIEDQSLVAMARSKDRIRCFLRS